MTDEERITEKIAEIAATADQYPAVIIIHHVPTQTVRYLSDWGLALLGATLEELTAMGPNFSPTYFNPVESDEYMARVFQLMYEGGPIDRRPDCRPPHEAVYACTDPVAMDTLGAHLVDKIRVEKGMKTLADARRDPMYIRQAAELGLGVGKLDDIRLREVAI